MQLEAPRPLKKRRAPFWLLMVGLVASCAFLGGDPMSGEHWKVVGGLQGGAGATFVEVDRPDAGAAVYNDAIAKLCASGCGQVGFFLPGDAIPSADSMSAFFRSGGWSNYSPAAVYFGDSFTEWDCEKAGVEGAPLTALCGDGIKERYKAVLALASGSGWMQACGFPDTKDEELLKRYISSIKGVDRRAQFQEAFARTYSNSRGPDDPAACDDLRPRIESRAKDARQLLKAATASAT